MLKTPILPRKYRKSECIQELLSIHYNHYSIRRETFHLFILYGDLYSASEVYYSWLIRRK